MDSISLNDIIRMYYDEDKSLYEIAEHFHTYPNKISRMLKKAGKKLRDKSKAMKKALKTGRLQHPTKDKEQSRDTKEKISQANAKNWKNKSVKEKSEISRKAKKMWDNMSDEDKSFLRKRATEATLQAAKTGSKLERYLAAELETVGYATEVRKEGLIENEKMHVDLYIPSIQTVVEVDGPVHLRPIYGEKSFEKRVNKDKEKNALITSHGFNIIRIRNATKHQSLAHFKEVFKVLVVQLDKIKKENLTKKIHIIEVN